MPYLVKLVRCFFDRKFWITRFNLRTTKNFNSRNPKNPWKLQNFTSYKQTLVYPSTFFFLQFLLSLCRRVLVAKYIPQNLQIKLKNVLRSKSRSTHNEPDEWTNESTRKNIGEWKLITCFSIGCRENSDFAQMELKWERQRIRNTLNSRECSAIFKQADISRKHVNTARDMYTEFHEKNYSERTWD